MSYIYRPEPESEPIPQRLFSENQVKLITEYVSKRLVIYTTHTVLIISFVLSFFSHFRLYRAVFADKIVVEVEKQAADEMVDEQVTAVHHSPIKLTFIFTGKRGKPPSS